MTDDRAFPLAKFKLAVYSENMQIGIGQKPNTFVKLKVVGIVHFLFAITTVPLRNYDFP
jgi:hypothetical protein